MAQAIHANYGDNFEVSVIMIISSIKNLLALHSDFEVKYVKRQTNSIAHIY